MQAQSILVVDDEPEMRLAVSHALSRSGYSVETAANGFEGLDKFKSEQFNIVITDVKMPDLSGLDVLAEVKKMSPEVPVIMITAYGTINRAVDAMKEGAADYILKPFSFETLKAAVKKLGPRPGVRCRNNFIEVYSRSNSEKKRIITQDPRLLKITNLAKNVATSNATILILGESGTGKELLASFIHQNSRRATKPYVAINCASLPENLAENELFGHEKGSFTGAETRKLGKFEMANHGTILLDEISEMAMPLQAKLLRVLQEREIDRVGGTKTIPVDVRIIAISNVDLKQAVQKGKFREDLFYRLNVIPFTIPPLRERKDDIPLLASYFLSKHSANHNKKMKRIAKDTISLLLKYDWKGNVRQLENIIERAVLLGEGEVLLSGHLFLEDDDINRDGQFPLRVGSSLKEMERELILQTLTEVDNNRTHAAKLLGISIRTLRNKLKEYNLMGFEIERV